MTTGAVIIFFYLILFKDIGQNIHTHSAENEATFLVDDLFHPHRVLFTGL